MDEFLIEHSFTIENIGKEPTYEVVRGNKHIQTCIDATLTRDNPGTINAWTVEREFNGSDHNTITFELHLSPKETAAERNWNKGEGSELTRLLKCESFYEPTMLTEKKLDRCLYQAYKKLQNPGHSLPAKEKEEESESKCMVYQGSEKNGQENQESV